MEHNGKILPVTNLKWKSSSDSLSRSISLTHIYRDETGNNYVLLQLNFHLHILTRFCLLLRYLIISFAWLLFTLTKSLCIILYFNTVLNYFLQIITNNIVFVRIVSVEFQCKKYINSHRTKEILSQVNSDYRNNKSQSPLDQ